MNRATVNYLGMFTQDFPGALLRPIALAGGACPSVVRLILTFQPYDRYRADTMIVHARARART